VDDSLAVHLSGQEACLLSVLNEALDLRRTEGTELGKEKNHLKDRGLPLGVIAVEEIKLGMGLEFQLAEIAEPFQPEVREKH
jgi:hypothetical protein